MTLGKRLWFGIVIVVLLGAAAGAAFVEIPDRVTAEPLTVPSGHIGDELTYAYHERATDESGPIPDGDWTLVGSESVHVERLSQTLDEHGNPREVVVLATNTSRVLSGPGGSTRYGGYGASMEFVDPSTEYDFVDLATRTAIRTDADRISGSAQGLADDLAVQFFFEKRPNLDGLRYQGENLVPKADVTHLNAPMAAASYAALVFGFNFPTLVPEQTLTVDMISPIVIQNEEPLPPGAEFTSIVSGSGLVNGLTALGVRTELVINVPEEDPEGEFRGIRTEETAGGKVRVVKTDWLSNELAYALASRVSVHLETAGGTERLAGDWMRTLAAFEAGIGPVIPWTDTTMTPHEVDRTPGHASLQTGTDSDLAYPLSLALEDAESHPALARFHLWRIQNPDAVLVQAKLRPGQSVGEPVVTDEWQLVFAAPGEPGYSVKTQRTNGLALAGVEDHGETHAVEGWGDFQVEDLPNNGMTLAAIEDFFSLYMGDSGQEDSVNFVVWGIREDDPGTMEGGLYPGCPELGDLYHIGPGEWEPFKTVMIGRTNGDHCAEIDQPFDEQALLVDMEQASPIFGYGVYREFDYLGLPINQEEGAPQTVVHAMNPSSLMAARVEAAAFGSTALLVLFLLGWFLPLLKYFGTKAAMFVPGFSRLARADLLDHKVRNQIMELIRQNPGIHASELKRRCSVGWGTVVHHLGVMEKNQLISSMTSGRHRRFFPVGGMDWSLRGQAAALANQRTRTLYESIRKAPGIPTTGLATQCDVNLSTAKWHLDRLEENGLIRRMKRGRKVHHYAMDPPNGS